jgi:RHS repeat-associated protein
VVFARSAGAVARTVFALALMVGGMTAAHAQYIAPPPTSTCPNGNGGGQGGSTPSTPGMWWNPNREGTGWHLMYQDDKSTLSLVWFTFDRSRRPVWLVSEANTVDPYSRTWQAQLYRYTWDYSANSVGSATRVGSVAIAFLPNDPMRAAVRWQWVEAGSSAYSECIRDFSRQGPSDYTPMGVNTGFNGAWFEPALSGWGTFLNVAQITATNPSTYVETTGLSFYDDAGEPVWTMAGGPERTAAPTVGASETHALTYYRAGSGYPLGVPTSNCVAQSGNCTVRYPNVGTWTRVYTSPTTANGKLAVTGYAHLLPSGVSTITRFNRPTSGTWAGLAKLTAVNQALVDRTQCIVPTGAASCPVTLNWAADPAWYPYASVFRRDLVTNAVQLLQSGSHGERVEPVQGGQRVAFELRASSSATSALLSRTPEVRGFANLLPTVQLTSPVTSTLQAPAAIAISATASDTDGRITKVEFFNGATLLATRTAAPYTHSLSNVAAGTYNIKARAYDDLNGTRDSATATVTVVSAAPPAPAGPDATSDAVGATVAEFRVDESGAATYKVPLYAAPGTAGVMPQLALAYSSQAGDGPQGRGWSIAGASTISRCRGSKESGDGENSPPVNFTSSDKFCLDGQRLLPFAAPAAEACRALTGAAVVQYRTEIESFQRICAYTFVATNGPRFFTSESKDGSIRWYGDRRATSGGPAGDYPNGVLEGNAADQISKVLLWAQTRVQDSNGNFIDYQYLKNPGGASKPGEHLLSRVQYTGKVTSGSVVSLPYASIDLVYGLAFESKGFLAGSQLWRTQRLTTIKSVSNGVTLRAYKLSYKSADSGSGAVMLERITECRDETSGATCLQPTIFNYGTSLYDLAVTASDVLPGLTVGSMVHFKSLKFGDIDGDGRPDAVWIKGGSSQCPHGEVRVAYGRLSTASGAPYFAEASGIRCVPTALLPDEKDNADNTITKGADASWMLLDYNGDGKDDLFMRSGSTWVGYASLGTGGSWGSENILASLLPALPVGSAVKHQPQLADLNGDGLLDIVYFRTEGKVLYARLMERGMDGVHRWGNERTVVIPAGTETDLCHGEAGCSWKFEGLYRKHNYQQLNDFNGDGRSDLLARASVTRTLPSCPGAGSGGGPGPGPGDPIVPQGGTPSIMAVCPMSAIYPLVVETVGAHSIAIRKYNDGLWRWDPAGFSRLSFADINGDGLTDLINHSDGSPNGSYLLNTGRGFGIQGGMLSPTAMRGSTLQVLDYNGDGRADVVYVNAAGTHFVVRTAKGVESNEAYGGMIYTSAFGPEQAISGGQSVTGCSGSLADVKGCLASHSYLFGDYDGDAVLDYIRIKWSAGNAASVKVAHARATARNRPRDTLQAITNGLGAVTNIRYLPLTNAEVHRRDFNSRNALSIGRGSPVSDLASPLYLVSQATSSAPTFQNPLAQSSIYYRYVGGKMQAGGRGFLGFREIHTIDTNHPGQHVVTVTGYRDDFPFIGRPHATIRRVASGSFAPDADCIGANRKDKCFQPSGSGFTPYMGIPVSWSTTDWANGVVLGPTAIPQRPRPGTSTDKSFDLVSGDHLASVVTAFGYDSWDNVTSSSVTTYAEAITFLVSGAVSTSNVYTNDVGKWHLGRLTSSTVTHKRAGVPDIVRSTSFEYDPATGLLTMERLQPNGAVSQDLRTYYVHDAYGNRLRSHTCSADVTEAACKSISVTFQQAGDTVQRYSEVSFGAGGRFSSAVYEPFWNGSGASRVAVSIIDSRDAFGNVTAARDVNGAKVRAIHGGLGRPYYTWTESVPGATLGDVSRGIQRWTTYRWCSGAGTAPQVACPSGARYREEVRTTGAPTQWTYFDALGRPLLAAAESFNAGQIGKDFSAVCTYNDARGRSARVSEPFFLPFAASGGAPQLSTSTCTAAGMNWSVTDYDVLDRPIAITAPDAGFTTVAYDKLKTTYTDPQLRTRTEVRNVFGEIASVTDAGGLVVNYSYDATGNLRFVRRNAGRGEIVNENVYDVRGRRIQSIDPDAGSWSYAYNAAGDLRAQTDSEGRRIEQRFDARGRVYQKLVDSGLNVRETTHTYVYDTASYGRGKLQSESVSGTYAGWAGQAGVANAFSRIYGYDALGRPSGETTLIDGVSYTTGREYDSLGRPFRSRDASGNWVRSDYTARGHVNAVCESPSSTASCAGDAATYVQTLETDARGNVIRERRGGTTAMDVRREYDFRTGRVTGLHAGSNNAIQSESYGWDQVGNLQWRDKAGQYREAFQYDALDRLQRARYERVLATSYTPGTGPLSEEVAYDKLGNICAKRVAGSYQPYSYNGRAGCGLNGVPGSAMGFGTGRPHAVLNAAGGAYSYDSHGNETSAIFAASPANHRYSRYTVENQAYEIARGSQSTPAQRSRFWYGSDGARYKREDTQSGTLKRTLYLGNVEIVIQGGSTTIKRYIAGVVVQDVVGTTKTNKYLFTDHLGSVVRVTNAAGSVLEGFDFGAFGERRGYVDPRSSWYTPVATTRGYTGHEVVDGMDVVHMNGRIYDSRLGRFMQADPVIQAPFNPQNWNAYSYVFNNPLSNTDPSGNIAIGQVVRIVMVVAITWATAGTAAPYFAAGASAGSIATGMAITATGGFVAGVVGSGSLEGGVKGAFSAMVFAGIGSYFQGVAAANDTAKMTNLSKAGLTTGQHIGKIAAHGIAGGVMSKVQGGKFGHGFASAGFTEAMSGPIGSLSNPVAQGAAVAIVGGSASAITGGKFANGAVTAAFSYAFASAAGGGRSGGEGEWIYPEGGSTDLNDYDTVMTNGILGNRGEFTTLVNREGHPGYFNPSRGFFGDLMESFGQKFFGWAGDPLAAGLARGLAGVNHPMTIIAHSQGTLTVANAVRYYGLSAQGSTFVMKSPALSHFTASRAIQGRGGTMVWRQPYGDIANIYAPSLNPLRWASGFGDIFCGVCRHTANGLP